MDPDEFLTIAGELATGVRQGDWRTAASRAYYAAFHVTSRLLRGAGFRVPDSDRAHGFIWLRLQHSGHPDIHNAADELRRLRRWRNQADYNFNRPFQETRGIDALNLALDIVDLLRNLQNEPTILARVVDAIRDYEHDIGEETWHAP